MIDPGHRSNSVRNSRICIYQESIRNWTEFRELEGIPESQITYAYLGMMDPGYRSNSGITGYIGLLGYDRIHPIPEFLLIPKNSFQFLGIPTNFASIQFSEFRDGIAFCLHPHYRLCIWL
jgi:hypothetical protein